MGPLAAIEPDDIVSAVAAGLCMAIIAFGLLYSFRVRERLLDDQIRKKSLPQRITRAKRAKNSSRAFARAVLDEIAYSLTGLLYGLAIAAVCILAIAAVIFSASQIGSRV